MENDQIQTELITVSEFLVPYTVYGSTRVRVRESPRKRICLACSLQANIYTYGQRRRRRFKVRSYIYITHPDFRLQLSIRFK